VLRVGDRLLFSPSNKSARVRSIECWNQEAPMEAKAGQSIGITLDEQIFVERGDIASLEEDPPILTTAFRATVFWLGRSDLLEGQPLRLKLATSEVPVHVQSIDLVIDTDTLGHTRPGRVSGNQVAEITLRSRRIVALDEYAANPQTGRCVLVDGYDTVAGGLVRMEGYPDQRGQLTIRSSNLTAVEHRVPAEARSGRNGHRGGVLWLTGLSGAGKSTLAMALEQCLFAKGYNVYVLDGDNVRHGLNADLGFSPEDRAENIRRVGEVAALFADAGLVVVTAFISPYQSDRDRARQAGPETFHEVYVKADLATCERRDPKGLYRRARSGEIEEFTGVSAPYQEPASPELVVDTTEQSVEQCLDSLVRYVEAKFALNRTGRPG
jgi:bifunctional enzyme CysN/CysC